MRLKKNQSKNISNKTRHKKKVFLFAIKSKISEKLSDFHKKTFIFLWHWNPLWKTKWLSYETLSGKKDYCINIYMILMLITIHGRSCHDSAFLAIIYGKFATKCLTFKLLLNNFIKILLCLTLVDYKWERWINWNRECNAKHSLEVSF